MPITITGTLATDESPSRSISSSFIIEPVDVSDTTQPLGTTYELVTGNTDSPSGTFWTIIENTGDAEVVYRLHLDGTNYVMCPLPIGGVAIIPPAMLTVGTTTMYGTVFVHARALTGSSEVRVITFYVL